MTSPVALDIEAIRSIRSVPTILRVIAETTGLRWVCIARVTDCNWTMCAVQDQLGFGMKPGDELNISDTFCEQVRRENVGVVIDSVSTDPVYSTHPVPKMFDIESYFSLPVHRSDGSFFGTLCGLDPLPAQLRTPKTLDMLKLFAELLSGQIESEYRLQEVETALEEEKHTAQLREQFIAVLGHDLRSPLSAMIAGADLISAVTTDEKVAGIARRITGSGKRIAGLIEDVMDFTRSRLGGALLPVERELTDELGRHAREVVDELRSAYPSRALIDTIALRKPVYCDPKRLGQMLSNLLVNAIIHGYAHTPVRVMVTDEDDILRLAVENDGPPLQDRVRERLFQPFSRGAEKKQADGLGLGLYIAAEIVRAHGGALRVETEGELTRFVCEIGPAATVADVADAAALSPLRND